MFLLGSGSAVFSSGKRASNEAQERSPSGVQFKISVQHSRPRPRPFHTGGPSGGFLRSISVADPDLELRGNPGALFACLAWLFFLRVFLPKLRGTPVSPGNLPKIRHWFCTWMAPIAYIWLTHALEWLFPWMLNYVFCCSSWSELLQMFKHKILGRLQRRVIKAILSPEWPNLLQGSSHDQWWNFSTVWKILWTWKFLR